MSFVSNDEYQKFRESFIELHKNEIEKRIADERNIFFTEREKLHKFIPAAKDYFIKFIKSHFLALLIGWALVVKDVYTIKEVFGFFLIQLFIFGFTYVLLDEDKNKIEKEYFWEKETNIVQEYIWEIRVKNLSAVDKVEEYVKVSELFAIAEHEIPKSIDMILIYKKYL